MMKKLVGRGPAAIVLEPEARLPELGGFEVSTHGEDCSDCAADAQVGWTATRRAGMFVESLRLEGRLTHAEARAIEPDVEVEWVVTASCRPDKTTFSGPTAAGTALISAAVAFYVTYASLESLPRKPSVHFSLATVMLVAIFGVTIVVLYKIVTAVSAMLVARWTKRPTRSMRTRVEKLAAFAAAIPELGLEAPSSR